MLQKGGTLKENCPSLSTYLTYEVTALGLKCQWKLPYCGILVLRREKGKCKLLAHNRRHFHCFGVSSLRCHDQTAKNLVAKIESTGHVKQEGLAGLIPSSALFAARMLDLLFIHQPGEVSVFLAKPGYFLNQHAFWVITPESESYFQSERWSALNAVFKL